MSSLLSAWSILPSHSITPIKLDATTIHIIKHFSKKLFQWPQNLIHTRSRRPFISLSEPHKNGALEEYPFEISQSQGNQGWCRSITFENKACNDCFECHQFDSARSAWVSQSRSNPEVLGVELEWEWIWLRLHRDHRKLCWLRTGWDLNMVNEDSTIEKRIVDKGREIVFGEERSSSCSRTMNRSGFSSYGSAIFTKSFVPCFLSDWICWRRAWRRRRAGELWGRGICPEDGMLQLLIPSRWFQLSFYRIWTTSKSFLQVTDLFPLSLLCSFLLRTDSTLEHKITSLSTTKFFILSAFSLLQVFSIWYGM